MIQGVNLFMTVIGFPLLPFLCSSALAQELVLWKLAMDFVGPVMFTLGVPLDWSLSPLVLLVSSRFPLLVLWFWLLLPAGDDSDQGGGTANRWWIVGIWDALMLTGALVSCLCDTSTSVGGGSSPEGLSRRRRVRRNRLAQQLGIALGLLCAGAVYLLLLSESVNSGERRSSGGKVSTEPRMIEKGLEGQHLASRRSFFSPAEAKEAPGSSRTAAGAMSFISSTSVVAHHQKSSSSFSSLATLVSAPAWGNATSFSGSFISETVSSASTCPKQCAAADPALAQTNAYPCGT